jgi:signal transduction histidine kinase
MKSNDERFNKIVEFAIPWLVLAILLTYSYTKFFQHPYGFRWRSNGIVDNLFVYPKPPTLQLADKLMQVGPVLWADFNSDLRKTFFDGARTGDIVPIVVERGGQNLTIPWTYPGFNLGDFYDQLISEWILAYFFWIAGLLTVLLVRPKDVRWRLITAFDFLTAIWLIAGSGNSAFHTWYSALVLRVVIWLCVPVYLHLHWIYPRSFGILPRLVTLIFYVVFLIVALAQAFQLFSSSFYLLGFIAAVLGSLILLVMHAIRQPETRRDLGLLTILFILALTPLIGIAIAGLINSDYPLSLNFGLLSLPLIPLAYLYAANRRLLGVLELRVNRLISAYLFLVLLGAIGIPFLALINHWLPSTYNTLIIGMIAGFISVVISIGGFPAFQRYVEQHWLGVSLPTSHLLEIYSARIATSNSFMALEELIKSEVLPSLLVKQFVFMQMSRPPRLVFAAGVGQTQIPDGQSLQRVISQSGRYRPMDKVDQGEPLAWIRLALPLKVGDELIGLWLLGRRDPDDYYSQADISLIESLANQTAIGLSNLLQTERLQTVYQADINRHEQERLSLARDLHDSILNQLASLLMNLEGVTLTPNFLKAYESLTHGVRETVSNLRPPLLDYGLGPAFDELAENLMERSNDKVDVKVDLQSNGNRYESLTELYLFRIIQEACENALHHGQADTISISGRLDPQQIDLLIEDNGLGFEAKKGLELNNLIANEHFGLVGMVERAKLINAEIHLDSAPNAGTRIRIICKPARV